MTKAEFIKKAKENNYTDEQIQEFEDLREEMKRETGYLMPYDKILLVEQPVY
jgi:hypothetical protein